MDQLTPNDELIKLVREVQEEFSYEMSESQCSWAVVMAFNPNFTIEDYNNTNGTCLKIRA